MKSAARTPVHKNFVMDLSSYDFTCSHFLFFADARTASVT
jgi:hypothetical protein